MRRSTLAIALVLASSSACSSESSSDDRGASTEGGGSDAGSVDEAGVDIHGGRDTEPASCFAACQNSAFSCQAKGASGTVVSEVALSGTSTGCEGSITPSGGDASALKLDCSAKTICTGGAPTTSPTDCVPGTYSAFTFGFVPKGGVLTICNRN